jgi:hypothetical protein
LKAQEALGVGPYAQFMTKKVQEIAKEEKLGRDRLKDLRTGCAKKYKELTTTGLNS